MLTVPITKFNKAGGLDARVTECAEVWIAKWTAITIETANLSSTAARRVAGCMRAFEFLVLFTPWVGWQEFQ